MDKKRISIHQAGHVVMYLERGLPIRSVEIKQWRGKWIGNTDGVVWGTDEKKVFHHRLLIALSGIVAEEIFYGSTPGEPIWVGHTDFDTALWNAERLVSKSDASTFVIDQMEEVRTTLIKNRRDIEIISRLLGAKESLLGKDIYNAIVKRYGSGYALN